MNKKFSLITVLLVVLALLLAACGPGDRGPAEPPAAGETPVADAGMDIDELLAALEAAGLPATLAGELDDPLFGGTPGLIDVNGEQVQVYEFESVEAAEEAAGTVSGEGAVIGNLAIDWAKPPHFYQSGGLVVLYAGESEEILGALEGALGAPFVVGSGLFGPIPDGEAALDLEQLVEALGTIGLPAVAAGAVDNPLFAGTPGLIEVDGEQVQVYVFESAEAAQEAAATVNPTGNIIGNISVDWAEPPHFYQSGPVIVVYAGESDEILRALASTLGDPFVVGSGLFGPIDETPEGEADLSAEQLLAALEAAGLAPEVDGVDGLGNPLFTGVTLEMLNVKGEQIHVYTFESAEAAQEAAATVNAEGNIIGNVTIDWAELPHFYQAGSLVVVYAGETEEVLGTLQATLGEPFVVGSGLFGPIDE